MENFLTTPNGSFIVTQNGYLIKNRPFEENLLPNGLLGDFSIENTIKVNGYITEWINRDQTQVTTMSNKLVQLNASYQFVDYGSYCAPPSASMRYYSPSGFVLSAGNNYTFIVVFDSSDYVGIKQPYIGNLSNYKIYNSGTSAFNNDSLANLENYYINGISSTASLVNKFNVISFSLTSLNVALTTVFGSSGSSSGKKIKSIAIYNRVLTPGEQFYNYQALKVRYNLI